MNDEVKLQHRVWADIVSLEPNKLLISSEYPEEEQPAVVRYFLALHLRGLADVRFARSRRAPRVATVQGLTDTGRELLGRIEQVAGYSARQLDASVH